MIHAWPPQETLARSNLALPRQPQTPPPTLAEAIGSSGAGPDTWCLVRSHGSKRRSASSCSPIRSRGRSSVSRQPNVRSVCDGQLVVLLSESLRRSLSRSYGSIHRRFVRSERHKVCQQATFSELEPKTIAWRGSPVRLCNDVGGEFRVSLDHCVRRVPKQLPKRFEVASVAEEFAREGSA